MRSRAYCRTRSLRGVRSGSVGTRGAGVSQLPPVFPLVTRQNRRHATSKSCQPAFYSSYSRQRPAPRIGIASYLFRTSSTSRAIVASRAITSSIYYSSSLVLAYITASSSLATSGLFSTIAAQAYAASITIARSQANPSIFLVASLLTQAKFPIRPSRYIGYILSYLSYQVGGRDSIARFSLQRGAVNLPRVFQAQGIIVRGLLAQGLLISITILVILYQGGLQQRFYSIGSLTIYYPSRFIYPALGLYPSAIAQALKFQQFTRFAIFQPYYQSLFIYRARQNIVSLLQSLRALIQPLYLSRGGIQESSSVNYRHSVQSRLGILPIDIQIRKFRGIIAAGIIIGERRVGYSTQGYAGCLFHSLGQRSYPSFIYFRGLLQGTIPQASRLYIPCLLPG